MAWDGVGRNKMKWEEINHHDGSREGPVPTVQEHTESRTESVETDGRRERHRCVKYGKITYGPTGEDAGFANCDGLLRKNVDGFARYCMKYSILGAVGF